MATSESRRRDLYNGLTELLGIERADTLMQFLPSIEGSQQATRTDVYSLSARIDDVERSLTTRIDNVERELTARIDRFEYSVTARFDAMNQRLDRVVVLTLAAGLMAIIATLVAQNFI
jgi:hypothetical protein